MDDYNYDIVISNIKNAICAKGMKQKAVAERAGFTPQEFSNILNERRKLLRVEYMPAIALAIGVDVNDLYGIIRKKGQANGELTDFQE